MTSSGAAAGSGGSMGSVSARKPSSASLHGRGPPLRLMVLLAVVVAAALLSLSLQMQGAFSSRRGLARRLERFGKPYVLARNLEYAEALGAPPQPLELDLDLDTDAERAAADSEHLNRLRDVCLSHGRSHIIPWTFGNGEGEDPELVGEDAGAELLNTLRECGDVDLFYADRDMGLGYCEDYAVYAKYLRARILPSWVLRRRFIDVKTHKVFTYHDLCPATPMLFFNHYWDDYPFSFAFSWPATKPVFLMPNIEMFELSAAHYWSVDLVLCKTAMCYDRVTKWYQQEGNPRNTAVVYTRHTSADYAAIVRKMDQERGEEITGDAKNYSDPVRFLHTSGKSLHKGTPQVLECWLTHPDLPPLDIYVHDQLWRERLAPIYQSYIEKSSNVRMHVGELPPDEFARLVAGTTFFMCPSIQEGYGHYMNQARAAKGLIVTTNAAPMNELVTDAMGVLITTPTRSHKSQMMGGEFVGAHGLRGVDGMIATFRADAVCEAVDKVIKQLTPAQREEKGRNARAGYLADQRAFAQTMKDIRSLVQKHKREVMGR